MPLCNFYFSQTEFVVVSGDFLATGPFLVLSPPSEALLTPLYSGSAHMPGPAMGVPLQSQGRGNIPLFVLGVGSI